MPRLFAASAALPTLTTARAAHDLASKEAAKGYPVRLRAEVTYYDSVISPPYPVLFVCDRSGCVYVGLFKKPAVDLEAGDLVEVTGKSGAGDFAPIVGEAEARVIGKAPLPAKAPAVSVTDVLSGKEDGQWVEVKGVVRSVDVWGSSVFMSLSLSDGIAVAVGVQNPAANYARLIDATVSLRGNASPVWNRQHQMTGFHILFPGLEAIEIEEPPPADVWALPVQRIGGLMRDPIGESLRHRVHIRGAVTLLWPERMICVQEETEGLCAKTHQASSMKMGQMVDVVGFAVVGEYTPTMAEAIYSPSWTRRPATPTPITAADALRGLHDAELVAIKGTVVGHVISARDPTLLLSSGGILFTASLPSNLSPRNAPEIEEGSLVRVTGICSIESDGSGWTTKEGFPIVRSIHILERFPRDAEVLRKPSWWNAAHTLKVLAAALIGTMGALWIVAFLSRRVKQQTATIRAQLAETQRLKEAAEFTAMHDGLTGVRNRRAIFEALHREYHLACRTGATTGILMLDLDHFKKVNDSYGHGAGDEVLKEAVRRILESVRETDLVGRYGGEEFLIVLPNCGKAEIAASGERIRSTICATPIQAAGLALPVTSSIGAVAARFPKDTEEASLAAADMALYEAKNTGRNRVVLHDVAGVVPAAPLFCSSSEPPLYIC